MFIINFIKNIIYKLNYFIILNKKQFIIILYPYIKFNINNFKFLIFKPDFIVLFLVLNLNFDFLIFLKIF